MNASTHSLALAALSLFAAACGGSSSGSGSTTTPPPAGATQSLDVSPDAAASLKIDSGALAGLVFSVPAGAVSEPVTITVANGSTTDVPARTIVGPAATFGPSGLTFSTPALLDLPLDPSQATNPTVDTVRVRLRDDRTGAIEELVPIGVDAGANTVRVEVPHFSTCWPTSTGGDPSSAGDFTASGVVTISGPAADIVGTSIEPNEFILFESGSDVPDVWSFLVTPFPIAGSVVGPDEVAGLDEEDFENLIVMNIVDVAGGAISMTIRVNGIDYDYTCTDLEGSDEPCGDLTIDVAAQRVTMIGVTAYPSGDTMTSPLVLDGILEWQRTI